MKFSVNSVVLNADVKVMIARIRVYEMYVFILDIKPSTLVHEYLAAGFVKTLDDV